MEFAPGNYGDYAGVTFYGPPQDGWFWWDRLDVSRFYLGPLFGAILDRSLRRGDQRLPQLVEEWNTSTGWCDVHKTIEVSQADGHDLTAALSQLTSEDLQTRITAAEVAAHLRCAAAICDFVTSRLNAGGLHIAEI